MTIDLAPGIYAVQVKPAAAKDAVLSKNPLVIALRAPAQDNKANVALVKFIKKQAGLQCRIKSGLTSKHKIIECF